MALSDFRTAYELSPILLNDGIATSSQNAENGTLTIASVLTSSGAAEGQFTFVVLPGSTLEEFVFGHYAFANQSTAANAVISQPLRISLRMIAPAQGSGGYTNKAAVFTSLKLLIDKHVQLGGTFTVVTPAYTWDSCILMTIRDVSSTEEGGQVQNLWQWDFENPLLTLAAAQAAYNSLLTKMQNGAQTTGDPPTQNQLAYV